MVLCFEKSETLILRYWCFHLHRSRPQKSEGRAPWRVSFSYLDFECSALTATVKVDLVLGIGQRARELEG
jgi:hypothetical protein